MRTLKSVSFKVDYDTSDLDDPEQRLTSDDGQLEYNEPIADKIEEAIKQIDEVEQVRRNPA